MSQIWRYSPSNRLRSDNLFRHYYTLGIQPIVLLFFGIITFIINDASHNQSADNIILKQNHNLIIQDCLHAQTADSPSVIQIHHLTIQNAWHNQLASNVVFSLQQFAIKITGKTENIELTATIADILITASTINPQNV
jgi:hypothetical protein